MALRSGEILHGRAVRVGRQHAHVDLHAAAQLKADLVVALGEHVEDAGEAQHLFDQRRALLVINAAGAGDQHVEIANGFAAAAQRAGRRDFVDALNVLEVLGQFLGGTVSFIEQESAGYAAIAFDRLEDLLLALFAEARQLAQLAFARQLLDALEVAHLKCAPHQRDGLRSEALDFQQLQHAGAILLQQFLMLLQFALPAQFLNVGGHAFADAGNLKQLLRLGQQTRRPAADGLRGLRQRGDKSGCGTSRRR